MQRRFETMTPVDNALIDAARALGPLLREHASQAERARRLPPVVLQALAGAKLQSLFTPKELGGVETDPLTAARVIEEIARHDTAAAWSLQAGNTGAWWGARLPAETAQAIYGSGAPVLTAAAFHPPQRAVEVPGGYRLTGRAPLASNVHDAPWLLLSGIVFAGDQPRLIDGQPEFMAFMFPAREAQIIDTWDALGMRATDSQDVVVEDLFVPKTHTYALRPDFEPNRYYTGPLYRYPACGEVGLVVAAVLLAAGRAAIDELQALARSKTPFGSMKTLRDRAAVQEQLARAEADLRAARLLFYDAIATAWQRCQEGTPHTLEQRADLMLANVHAADTAARVTAAMHQLAGTSGIYTRSPLERLLRDVQTLRHHGFATAARYETFGQVHLGLPPEFPLVAF
jgi:alkylation response protein AidB-like acyl-CoA dehydrogenase